MNESIAFPLSLTVIFIQKSVFWVIVNLGQVEQSFVQMLFRFIFYYSALSELSWFLLLFTHMCNLRESARQFFVQKCEIAADYGFFLYSFPDFPRPFIFS